MLYKPQSMLWLPMFSSHFFFWDISLYQRDDTIKNFCQWCFYGIHIDKVRLFSQSYHEVDNCCYIIFIYEVTVIHHVLCRQHPALSWVVLVALSLWFFDIALQSLYPKEINSGLFLWLRTRMHKITCAVFNFLSFYKLRYLSHFKVESISRLNPVKLYWGLVSRIINMIVHMKIVCSI